MFGGTVRFCSEQVSNNTDELRNYECYLHWHSRRRQRTAKGVHCITPDLVQMMDKVILKHY